MNRKLVTLLSCLAVVVIIVICMSIAFTINGVSVNTTNGLSMTEEEINEIYLDSGIVKHSSIFGLDEDISISNIEMLHPDLKVISIERKFPNKVVINITKRIPIIAVSITDGTYALLDRELKVVEIVNEIEDKYISYISGIKINTIQKGSFVEDFDWLENIVSSAEKLSFVNRRFSSFIVKIEREIYTEVENNKTLLTTNTGVVFVIDDVLGSDAFNYFYTNYMQRSDLEKSTGYIKYNADEKKLVYSNSLI